MAEEPPTVPARIELTIPAGTISGVVPVPTGPRRADDFLPLARALSDQVVGLTVLRLEEAGRPVSCGPRCGACCRQLVPISEAEARLIRDLIERLPEPRRAAIRARFDEARRRLDAAGLLAPLLDDDRNFWDVPARDRFAVEYFRLGLACPFLEDESCSIHPERPIACREYLVTSDPKHCAEASSPSIENVHLPALVWGALARLSETPSGEVTPPWVPLVLAPSWAESHPDGSAPRPGTELFRELLSTVAGMVAENAARAGPPEAGASAQA
jgi:Fe-S-cluster containining protein